MSSLQDYIEKRTHNAISATIADLRAVIASHEYRTDSIRMIEACIKRLETIDQFILTDSLEDSVTDDKKRETFLRWLNHNPPK